MAATTFPISAVGIVASRIIEDLEISREQLGYVATTGVVIAAAVSLQAGRTVDRIGGRKGFVGVFALSSLAFVVMSGATAYWILVAAAAVGGVALAGGNPVTNKLIVLHMPRGSRGVVTGIKQSGVQAASFIGGLVLPLGAVTIGWRATLFAFGVATALLIVPVLKVVPRDRTPSGPAPDRKEPMPSSTRWLAVYGALLGFGGSAAFFLPLFAEEAVGYDPRGAGLAAAVMGLAALGGRIGWARYAERGQRFISALGTIAILAILGGFAFVGATSSAALLWIGAVVFGVSATSWNSVVMVAVMYDAGVDRAGRASGAVMLGFLIGLAVGGPAYGRSVDVTGSYTLMWWLAITAFAGGAILAALWARSIARASPRRVASAG